jgi:hypothetical protein
MMNLIDLHDGATQLASWRATGYGQNGNFTLKSAIPYAGTKSMLFQLTCHGETVQAIHVSHLMFTGLTYFTEDNLPENVDYLTLEYKGENYYLIRPDVHTEVKVLCSCSDFIFSFAMADYRNKCLFGSMPKKYKRKAGSNRKPRNPNGYIGECKHIFQAQSLLHNKGYLA